MTDDFAYLHSETDPIVRHSAVQAALQRYAQGTGSSHAVVAAVLSAARVPTLRTALTSAVHALRSYQYGNGSPDLAEATADACEPALQPAPNGGA